MNIPCIPRCRLGCGWPSAVSIRFSQDDGVAGALVGPDLDRVKNNGQQCTADSSEQGFRVPKSKEVVQRHRPTHAIELPPILIACVTTDEFQPKIGCGTDQGLRWNKVQMAGGIEMSPVSLKHSELQATWIRRRNHQKTTRGELCGTSSQHPPRVWQMLDAMPPHNHVEDCFKALDSSDSMGRTVGGYLKFRIHEFGASRINFDRAHVKAVVFCAQGKSAERRTDFKQSSAGFVLCYRLKAASDPG